MPFECNDKCLPTIGSHVKFTVTVDPKTSRLNASKVEVLEAASEVDELDDEEGSCEGVVVMRQVDFCHIKRTDDGKRLFSRARQFEGSIIPECGTRVTFDMDVNSNTGKLTAVKVRVKSNEHKSELKSLPAVLAPVVGVPASCRGDRVVGLSSDVPKLRAVLPRRKVVKRTAGPTGLKVHQKDRQLPWTARAKQFLRSHLKGKPVVGASAIDGQQSLDHPSSASVEEQERPKTPPRHRALRGSPLRDGADCKEASSDSVAKDVDQDEQAGSLGKPPEGSVPKSSAKVLIDKVLSKASSVAAIGARPIGARPLRPPAPRVKATPCERPASAAASLKSDPVEKPHEEIQKQKRPAEEGVKPRHEVPPAKIAKTKSTTKSVPVQGGQKSAVAKASRSSPMCPWDTD